MLNKIAALPDALGEAERLLAARGTDRIKIHAYAIRHSALSYGNAGAVKRGGFTDIHQAAAASATGRGRCGRTVIATSTPAMPIADDAT